MKQIKNSVTLTLMISSVVLLMALQFFWLRSSYEQSFIDFRRESSILFRSTLFNLRDSLFVQNIEPVGADSMIFGMASPYFDSVRIKMTKRDTLRKKYRIRERGSQVQVFIASTGKADSDVNILKPLASSIHHFDGNRSFVIRMGPDTLNIDTLAMHFSRSLGLSGITSPFHIKHISIGGPILRAAKPFGMPDDIDPPQPRERRMFRDTLFTERVPLNPMHAYAAFFPDMRLNVFKEIAPQIFFCLFLTAIIVTSFVMMYRSLRTQQRLMELKNDFINNVTHELKTPVATVSVALEALKDFHALENRERTKEYLSIAQNELNRLTLMTDKILKASVFERQGVSFIPEHVNLDRIIEEVVTSMKLVFEKKRLAVNYVPSGVDFVFEGSDIHITNVVYNLIDNAIKYGHENSSIDIQLTGSDNHLKFSIGDHGPGIPKEYHKKIFEKFFRVPTGDVHNVKGYGLGLNYVAEVVRSHQGTIMVESAPGEGSCFIITLPRRHVKN
jgi:two-component system, OmpR family, phosphate regulon sensor histidine kinase PhoR